MKRGRVTAHFIVNRSSGMEERTTAGATLAEKTWGRALVAHRVVGMVKKKCEHGRQRSRCKDCGGSSFCEHGRRRHDCKDCGGGSICEHGRLRNRCKDCGGSGVCEHGRRRSRCKDCGGSGICEHGRQRSVCKRNDLGQITVLREKGVV